MVFAGKLDKPEIITSFKKLGINLTPKEAERLLKRMDPDGSLAISFNEFRDYFLWYPSAAMKDLFGYWRHSTVRATLLIYRSWVIYLHFSSWIWVKMH